MWKGVTDEEKRQQTQQKHKRGDMKKNKEKSKENFINYMKNNKQAIRSYKYCSHEIILPIISPDIIVN